MEIILAAIVSFVVTAVVGKFLIPALVRLKAGQSIKEIGPKWHMSKQGTPTMGGLMFIIGIGVAIVICGWRGMLEGSFQHLYVYLFALVFGGIGYIDDYQKVKHHQNTGLTAPQKFILQLAAAVAFLCLMRYEGMLSPNLYIPFFNTYVVLSWGVYLVFAAFVIVGTVNAVNITDGIDGLSSSVTLPVAAFFAWEGCGYMPQYLVLAALPVYYGQLSLFSAALCGGLVGSVFMGDTGSLFWAARWRRWLLPTICTAGADFGGLRLHLRNAVRYHSGELLQDDTASVCSRWRAAPPDVRLEL